MSGIKSLSLDPIAGSYEADVMATACLTGNVTDLCRALWNTVGVTIVTVIVIVAVVGMARVFARFLLVSFLSSIVRVVCRVAAFLAGNLTDLCCCALRNTACTAGAGRFAAVAMVTVIVIVIVIAALASMARVFA